LSVFNDEKNVSVQEATLNTLNVSVLSSKWFTYKC